MSRTLILLAAFISTQAMAVDRWVPPPAPPIKDGTPIQPQAEIYGDSHFIVHLPKPEQADWRQTRYRVHLQGNEAHAFGATLSTEAFGRDDEVVFLTIPKGSKAQYEIEVIDRSSYPYVRVFKGGLGMIPEIKD